MYIFARNGNHDLIIHQKPARQAIKMETVIQLPVKKHAKQ